MELAYPGLGSEVPALGRFDGRRVPPTFVVFGVGEFEEGLLILFRGDGLFKDPELDLLTLLALPELETLRDILSRGAGLTTELFLTLLVVGFVGVPAGDLVGVLGAGDLTAGD